MLRRSGRGEKNYLRQIAAIGGEEVSIQSGPERGVTIREPGKNFRCAENLTRLGDGTASAGSRGKR